MPLSQPQTKRAEGVPVTSCWNCKGAVSGTHFCGACGKIQPLPAGMDYFAFFGLPRKLTIEPAALEGQFHMLSWKLHPDNFVRAGEFERNLSLQRSSELNDAYRTLREPLTRVEYLLEILNVRKEGTTKQQAPPELLEEVFELNESLDELREAREAGGVSAALRGKLDAAAGNFQAKLTDVDGELAGLAGEWDAAFDSGADEAKRAALLARMSEVLNRRSYIRNLVDGVQKEIAAS
ncbi:MAG TPA: Fe-S protein assembly co-chaperone HscB [Candidatus Acidoferrales bacterium]